MLKFNIGYVPVGGEYTEIPVTPSPEYAAWFMSAKPDFLSDDGTALVYTPGELYWDWCDGNNEYCRYELGFLPDGSAPTGFLLDSVPDDYDPDSGIFLSFINE